MCFFFRVARTIRRLPRRRRGRPPPRFFVCLCRRCSSLLIHFSPPFQLGRGPCPRRFPVRGPEGTHSNAFHLEVSSHDSPLRSDLFHRTQGPDFLKAALAHIADLKAKSGALQQASAAKAAAAGKPGAAPAAGKPGAAPAAGKPGAAPAAGANPLGGLLGATPAGGLMGGLFGAPAAAAAAPAAAPAKKDDKKAAAAPAKKDDKKAAAPAKKDDKKAAAKVTPLCTVLHTRSSSDVEPPCACYHVFSRAARTTRRPNRRPRARTTRRPNRRPRARMTRRRQRSRGDAQRLMQALGVIWIVSRRIVICTR